MSRSFDLVVVIPTYNRKTLLTRAIDSVLHQDPSVSRCVVVADDRSTDGTLPFIAEKFPREIQERKILLHSCKRSGDPASSRNQGARAAPPSEWFGFLDHDDYWGSDRIERLKPLFPHSDVIFEVHEEFGKFRDPLKEILAKNLIRSSGTLIRRTLFEKVGGYSEGYYGSEVNPKPKKGWEDYETWIRILLELQREGNLKRALFLSEKNVFIEHPSDSAGTVGLRNQMRRELGTLLRLMPKFPIRYQPLLLRRCLGAAKASLLG